MTRRIAAGLVALLPFAAAAIPAAAADRPVVVELFTSQGCSSCPPADQFLADLAHRPGVLALAFHVDYWDRLGWKDPFSSALASARQRDYDGHLRSEIYTPQMVIDGRVGAVGSDRHEVEGLIAAARQRAAADTAPPQPRIDRHPDGWMVEIAAVEPHGEAEPATIELVTYDPSQVTAVPRGENGGRTLHEANIVRSIRRIGDWHGEAFSLTVTRTAEDAGTRAAILVRDPSGTVRGAAVEGETGG